jgi:hypothetical protein
MDVQKPLETLFVKAGLVESGWEERAAGRIPRRHGFRLLFRPIRNCRDSLRAVCFLT